MRADPEPPMNQAVIGRHVCPLPLNFPIPDRPVSPGNALRPGRNSPAGGLGERVLFDECARVEKGSTAPGRSRCSPGTSSIFFLAGNFVGLIPAFPRNFRIGFLHSFIFGQFLPPGRLRNV